MLGGDRRAAQQADAGDHERRDVGGRAEQRHLGDERDLEEDGRDREHAETDGEVRRQLHEALRSVITWTISRSRRFA